MLNTSLPIKKLDNYANKCRGKTFHLLDVLNYLRIDKALYTGVKIYLQERNYKIEFTNSISCYNHLVTF